MSVDQQLYQQVILDHNKKPRNFGSLQGATHDADGYNPLCGDRFHVYLTLNDERKIVDVGFDGQGCAISKASASMMTEAVRGLSADEASELFEEFHDLLTGKLDPEERENKLGKLKIFAGIWKYPSRVKCAALAWHALRGAMDDQETVSTE